MQIRKFVFVMPLFILASCFNKKVEQPTSFYFPQVKAIIQANCVTCHHQGGQGMPVFLTTDSLIVSYAANIKAAVIDPVSPFNKRMPLGGQLSSADTAVIGRWFAKGGKATD